jgi:hypothetical protein
MAALRSTSLTCLSLAVLASLSGCNDGGRSDGDEFGDGIETLGGETDTGETGETDDTDTGETDETAETADDEEEPPTCSSTTATAAAVPPNVVLVLDKSRSMVLHSWDDDGLEQTDDVTRWYSLYQTVEIVGEQYASGMSLGLTLFPSSQASSDFDEACLVESEPDVPVGSHTAADLLAVMPDADELDIYGATPAAAGIATARAHLAAIDDGRPKAMILVTDGAANCGADAVGNDKFQLYDEDVPQIVSDAWMIDQIPTYVVGIDIEETSQNPDTQPREKLDEVAQLGGVPREGEVGFYDARDADALLAALDEIAASVSCTVELGQAPTEPDQLVISIDGEVVQHLDSCEDGSGWVYADPDLMHIELCNAACDALLAEGEIEAEFTCPPQP